MRRPTSRRRPLISAALIVALSPLATPSQAVVTRTEYARLRAETFEAAQGAVVSSAATALGNVASRLGAGQGALAAKIREREALVSRLKALRKQIQAISESAGDSVAAIAQRTKARALRDEESGLALKLAELDTTIDRDFPAYAELTRPAPLNIKDTQALLEEDEAILLIVPAADATYIWAVTREGFDWARSSLSETEITDAVKVLRRELDPSTATRGAIGIAGGPTSASQPKGPAGFDRKTAFKLYSELIAPLEPVFRKKSTVMVATAGALQSLPFAVLVTAEPQGADNDRAYVRETPWLIDRYALVTLPAISSLRTLRCLSTPTPHKGCKGPTARGRSAGRATLAYAGLGGPTLGGGGGESRGAEGWEKYSRGDLADPDALRSLAPLPGAEAEIGALSTLFAKSSYVRTRDAFTETLVKTSPEVRQARVIHFATHALMSGELGGGEPGLVLTPPSQSAASAQDDGLLTASEAAVLDLHAEFVVLSACNTARADGTLGADGLAGLARSFFFAGARSLLVSHWSVDDKSTRELMVTLFTNLQDGKVSRAVALQQAIQSVKRQSAFVEPRFWAPFVIVGEGDDA